MAFADSTKHLQIPKPPYNSQSSNEINLEHIQYPPILTSSCVSPSDSSRPTPHNTFEVRKSWAGIDSVVLSVCSFFVVCVLQTCCLLNETCYSLCVRIYNPIYARRGYKLTNVELVRSASNYTCNLKVNVYRSATINSYTNQFSKTPKPNCDPCIFER